MHTLIITLFFIILFANGSTGIIHLPLDIQKKIFYYADPDFLRKDFIVHCSHQSYLGSATDLRKFLNIKLSPLALTSKHFYNIYNTADTNCNDIIEIIEYFKTHNAIFFIDEERKKTIVINLFNTFCGNQYLKFYAPLSQDLNDPNLETIYMTDDTQNLILTKVQNPFYNKIQQPFNQLFFYSISWLDNRNRKTGCILLEDFWKTKTQKYNATLNNITNNDTTIMNEEILTIQYIFIKINAHFLSNCFLHYSFSKEKLKKIIQLLYELSYRKYDYAKPLDDSFYFFTKLHPALNIVNPYKTLKHCIKNILWNNTEFSSQEIDSTYYCEKIIRNNKLSYDQRELFLDNINNNNLIKNILLKNKKKSTLFHKMLIRYLLIPYHLKIIFWISINLTLLFQAKGFITQGLVKIFLPFLIKLESILT